MVQGIMLVTKDVQIPVINSRCAELLDLPAGVIENPPRFDQLGEQHAQIGDLRTAATPTDRMSAEHSGPQADPGQFTICERTMPNGNVIEVRSGHLPDGGFVQTFTDITKRCEVEARVARLASEDPLTGLPNRRGFSSPLDQNSPRPPPIVQPPHEPLGIRFLFP